MKIKKIDFRIPGHLSGISRENMDQAMDALVDVNELFVVNGTPEPIRALASVMYGAYLVKESGYLSKSEFLAMCPEIWDCAVTSKETNKQH